MTAPKTIFAAQHDPFTRIGVTLEPVAGKGSLVVSVYRMGADKPQRIRYAVPQDVTTWFKANSAKNARLWSDAWLATDIAVGKWPSDVEIEVKPRQVPYHSQRNNEIAPSSTCNVTSYAMALSYFDLPTIIKEKPQIEDNLGLWMRYEHLERTDHADLVRMGRAHKLDTSFATGVSLAEMRESLAKGYILVVSGKFTSSGHIVCVYGTKGRDFLVHDPWGSYNTRYKDHDGKALVYTEATMQDVCITRRSSGVWVHTIKGVLK